MASDKTFLKSMSEAVRELAEARTEVERLLGVIESMRADTSQAQEAGKVARDGRDRAEQERDRLKAELDAAVAHHAKTVNERNEARQTVARLNEQYRDAHHLAGTYKRNADHWFDKCAKAEAELAKARKELAEALATAGPEAGERVRLEDKLRGAWAERDLAYMERNQARVEATRLKNDVNEEGRRRREAEDARHKALSEAAQAARARDQAQAELGKITVALSQVTAERDQAPTALGRFSTDAQALEASKRIITETAKAREKAEAELLEVQKDRDNLRDLLNRADATLAERDRRVAADRQEDATKAGRMVVALRAERDSWIQAARDRDKELREVRAEVARLKTVNDDLRWMRGLPEAELRQQLASLAVDLKTAERQRDERAEACAYFQRELAVAKDRADLYPGVVRQKDSALTSLAAANGKLRALEAELESLKKKLGCPPDLAALSRAQEVFQRLAADRKAALDERDEARAKLARVRCKWRKATQHCADFARENRDLFSMAVALAGARDTLTRALHAAACRLAVINLVVK